MSSRSSIDRAGSSYVYHTAMQALTSGVSVVPIRTDGTKQPSLPAWREYQHRRASEEEIERWFRIGEPGIAFVTGSVSGHLEALDFDHLATFEAWVRFVEHDAVLSSLYKQVSWGYLEATPGGGRHLLYRCSVIEQNQKLAVCSDGKNRKTLIETRGDGGLIIVAPSRGRVHVSGKSYILLRGGVSSIRTITPQQRQLLLTSARSFDKMPYPSRPFVPHLQSALFPLHDNQRPGDIFNRQASWEDVLVPHGWHLLYSSHGVGYWRRPGKHDGGVSATTNYDECDLLYVFSTSTCFEAEKGYTKFSAYALLNHAGHFGNAARTLAEKGYRASNFRV